jgi:hypothetical protein
VLLVLGFVFALVLLFAVATLVVLLRVVAAGEADGGDGRLLVRGARDSANFALARRGKLSW